MLAQGRIKVDGQIAHDVQQRIGQFMQVSIDERVLQDKTAVYIMLNKPMGVASATKDPQHKTVIELLVHPQREQLHIAGRLDFNSTGLLLLTNDGQWSRQLSHPNARLEKRYRVTLQNPLNTNYIAAFAKGMKFDFEGITTQPAGLTIIDAYTAEVILTEGRYHQIKRMFGRFQNPVTALHRVSIGNLVLDQKLNPGESRLLSPAEVVSIHQPCKAP